MLIVLSLRCRPTRREDLEACSSRCTTVEVDKRRSLGRRRQNEVVLEHQSVSRVQRPELNSHVVVPASQHQLDEKEKISPTSNAHCSPSNGRVSPGTGRLFQELCAPLKRCKQAPTLMWCRKTDEKLAEAAFHIGNAGHVSAMLSQTWI